MINQNCEVYGLNSKIAFINDNVMTNNYGDLSLVDVNKGENWKFKTIV